MQLSEAIQLPQYSVVRMKDDLATYCDHESPYWGCFNKNWVVDDLLGDLSAQPTFRVTTMDRKESASIPIEYVRLTPLKSTMMFRLRKLSCHSR